MVARMPVSRSIQSLKILIAEDDSTDRFLLKKIIVNDGHQVIEAIDGLDAIEKFIEFQPDLILMDALMPRMDGIDAVKKIKPMLVETFVPIIFLTSLSDAESIARCLDSGGDDFISKPYNKLILRSKISALLRVRELHNTVLIQRDHIAHYNAHLLHEQEAAKAVFNKIAHKECIQSESIRHILSPMSVFNGDIFLAAQSPSGAIMAFLGDFTGHGLSAAIGTLPVAEIFYGMSQKGFALDDILKEINKRLTKILPPGVFCCACAIQMNFKHSSILVWNGGMPDIVVYKTREREFFTIKSTNLPLGILNSEKFMSALQEYEISDGDRVYFCSDGIVEAQNQSLDMYGIERYLKVFQENSNITALFDEHIASLKQFSGNDNQNDDLSFVEMVFKEDTRVLERDRNDNDRPATQNWKFEYELRDETLKDYNPIPLLIHIIQNNTGDRFRLGEVYTILSELYSNALEHGVLGLDSEKKKNSDGFLDYYSARQLALNNLKNQYIKFTIEHLPGEKRGELLIVVSDSGRGFNYNDKLHKSKRNSYSGRGLAILNSLCNSVEFMPPGNSVKVRYSGFYQHEVAALLP